MAGVDAERIERAVLEILLAIGEDPARPGLERTPQRVAEAYADFFGGLEVDPLTHLADTVPLGATEAGVPATSDAVILRDLAFRSVCEHHLLPFVGTAHVAYLPGDRVVGLGRIPAVVDTLARRPQLQERLAEEIADALEAGLAPRGVLVVLDAVHGCVTTRGTRQEHSSTVTVASRGALAEPTARAEIIALIGSGRGA
jgi:GTP cyclohydrolase I